MKSFVNQSTVVFLDDHIGPPNRQTSEFEANDLDRPNSRQAPLKRGLDSPNKSVKNIG